MTRIATVTTELELRLVVPGGPSLPGRWPTCATPRTTRGPCGWRSTPVARATASSSGCSPGSCSPTASPARSARATCGCGRRCTAATGSCTWRWPRRPGSALFEIDRDALVEFLQQTYLAVPTGAEEDVVDLDAELALLLSRG